MLVVNALYTFPCFYFILNISNDNFLHIEVIRSGQGWPKSGSKWMILFLAPPPPTPTLTLTVFLQKPPYRAYTVKNILHLIDYRYVLEVFI